MEGTCSMIEEFKDQLLTHAKKSVERAMKATNEEATKQWLIVPFLQLLGYDPTNPDEVLPEADASFSEKHKNRVDYAICKDQEPVIAVEAKKVGSLTNSNRGELKGYYNAVITVKLGILSDGLIYQLYSDTDQENLMDDEPFATVDLTHIAQGQISDDILDALLKLRPGTFDPADIGADARRKIYISAYVEVLEQAFRNPDEALIRTLMDSANVEGRRNKRLIEEHREILSEAMNAFFDKKLLERVGFAEREDLVKFSNSEARTPAENLESAIQVGDIPEMKSSSIVTTETELKVYDYVRHRLPFLIDQDEELFSKLENIYYKDYQSAFTVSYKQNRKGRLFNFRESSTNLYRFEFPVTDEIIITNQLSDIDQELLSAFMSRVEQLG